MNKRFRTIIQYVIFFGLGIFFAWLSFKNLDNEKIAQIKVSFRNARLWLVFPVFVVLFISHLVRALRWKLLMEPLSYNPSTANTFFAVMIGYLVNIGVPRLGEIVKCTVLSRAEKIPADKLIGTMILERLIDTISLLTVFGITLIIQPHLYSQILNTFFNAESATEEATVATWLITVIIFSVILLLIGLWMLIKKKTIKDLLVIFKKIVFHIIEGVAAIKHLKKRKLFIVLTLILWTLYVMGGYVGFLALQETQHYGIKEAFTILSAGSIGMIASPGGIGAYAYMIQKTMELYGLNYTIALAFGWLLWLAQTVVVVLGGLFSFAALPYYNKKLTSDPI
jgi:uncharacterized protein (TIRG00374 family)